MFNRILAALALCAAFASAAPAQDLGIGDAAPKLQVKEFVKGDAVKDFEKGKVYVVEFWATWCGPCRTSIPHVSGLQKEYKDVTFIGVSVWEEDSKGVKPFVEKMGDQMAYRVAVDDVPEKGDGSDGAMAKGWMKAAAQDGIPAAFIINGEGKVAWIGHPMQMDKPLKQIVDGTYDLKAAATEYKAKAERQKKLRALQEKLIAARMSGDPKKTLAVIDEAVKEEPSLEEMLGQFKLSVLRQTDDTEQTMAYVKHLIAKVYGENAQGLNAVAWMIVDPDAEKKADPKLVKLAVEAAVKADSLAQNKDASIADTLAKAYFDSGDVAKAVETQERALKLAKGTELEKDEDLQKRLEQYKKALDKK